MATSQTQPCTGLVLHTLLTNLLLLFVGWDILLLYRNSLSSSKEQWLRWKLEWHFATMELMSNESNASFKWPVKWHGPMQLWTTMNKLRFQNNKRQMTSVYPSHPVQNIISKKCRVLHIWIWQNVTSTTLPILFNPRCCEKTKKDGQIVHELPLISLAVGGFRILGSNVRRIPSDHRPTIISQPQ